MTRKKRTKPEIEVEAFLPDGVDPEQAKAEIRKALLQFFAAQIVSEVVARRDAAKKGQAKAEPAEIDPGGEDW